MVRALNDEQNRTLEQLMQAEATIKQLEDQIRMVNTSGGDGKVECVDRGRKSESHSQSDSGLKDLEAAIAQMRSELQAEQEARHAAEGQIKRLAEANAREISLLRSGSKSPPLDRSEENTCSLLPDDSPSLSPCLTPPAFNATSSQSISPSPSCSPSRSIDILISR